MAVDRRTYLAMVGVGIGAGPAVARGATEDSTIRVTGEVVSATGDSVHPGKVKIFSCETGSRSAQLSNGRFEATLQSGNNYVVTYFHETESGTSITEFDDVPLFYGLENNVFIEEETDLGTYELPKGYDVDLGFEDGDGNPVQDLRVGFRLPNGTGTGPRGFVTNSEGYLYHISGSASETGVELAGTVTVEVRDPMDHTNTITPTQLSITEDQEVTVPIQNPAEWGGQIVGSDTEVTTDTPPTTAGAETQPPTEEPEEGSGSRRGFFSNSAEEPEFLSNPFNLTTLGFLLSVAGIIHQMMGGQ
jgi:hypothetical protein